MKKPPLDTLKSARPVKNVPVKTAAEREIESHLRATKVQAEHKKKKKRMIKRGIIVVVLLLLGYGIKLLFTPYKGTMAFGICKVFLEQQVTYPHMLELTSIETFEKSVRIWFFQTDSFGDNRMEAIQCYYRPDPNYGSALERVTINRREVNPDVVAKFNNSIPSIIAYPPDLTLPFSKSDTLEALHYEVNTFMRPIF